MRARVTLVIFIFQAFSINIYPFSTAGGPLVTPNPDLYELIGVVSWGVGCALADYPGVYARMTERLDWVYERTAGSWNTCGRCTGSDCPGRKIPSD